MTGEPSESAQTLRAEYVYPGEEAVEKGLIPGFLGLESLFHELSMGLLAPWGLGVRKGSKSGWEKNPRLLSYVATKCEGLARKHIVRTAKGRIFWAEREQGRPDQLGA